MQTISLAELRDKLLEQRGATVISMVTRTSPDLVGGKKCPLVGMEKVSYVVGMINWDYSNSVNRQRIRENQPIDGSGEVEEFKAMPRAWGRRLHKIMSEERGKEFGNRKRSLLPFVHHTKGVKWSLEDGDVTIEELKTLPVEELSLEFKPENTVEYKYFLDGKEVDKELAHQHVRPASASSRQETRKEIILRDYKLTSIEQVTIGGEVFIVK